MGGKRKTRARTATELSKETDRPHRFKKTLSILLPIVAIAILGVAAYFVFSPSPSIISSYVPSAQNNPSDTSQPIKFTRKAKTLDNLLAMNAEQLAGVDIAEMNLLCATGLPGGEKIDIDHCLATLDRWTQRVKFETERHLYRVHDPKWADSYRHSEAYLRASFLLQTLQEDLGVKYDMTAKDNFKFDDSRVAFIHGMIPAANQNIGDTPGGTCTSMPVMYVAVGRRLGYPLKLVLTDSHIFVRWDGKNHSHPAWRERFNIEGTNGFSSYEDNYYTTWPRKLTETQVRENRYLLSLSPPEELAQFLASRGHCGVDNKQLAFAARCYENAYRQDSSRPSYQNWFLDTAMKSGYRPVTPTLARLLSHRMRLATARRSSADPVMSMPKPSETVVDMRGILGAPYAHEGQWHTIPQTPDMPIGHTPQPQSNTLITGNVRPSPR